MRRRLASLAVLGLTSLVCAAPAHAAPGKLVPPSAADVSRAWVRDWSLGQQTAVCSEVAQPLLLQMALASGTSACSGAVASDLRAARGRWAGASIVTQRAELIDDRLARVTFSLRHALKDSAPVIPDRIYLNRPDARTGSPWRVASLGLLPFIAGGAADIALDPSTLDPPGTRAQQDDPVQPGGLSPACGGQAVTVNDPGGDVRAPVPALRAAGQLLPSHPRGPQFGTIVADRPFAFTGPRRREPALDLRALTMSRESNGHVCLQVRFARAPRPDTRLLVRWFEPVPGSDTQGASGAVELRWDGRGGLHFWFDRLRTEIADPDLAGRFRGRVPSVGRRGNVVSIRLSKRDLNDPARFRIALQSASTSTADPGDVHRIAAGDTMGGASAGFEWPNGERAPLFDPGAGPVG